MKSAIHFIFMLLILAAASCNLQMPKEPTPAVIAGGVDILSVSSPAFKNGDMIPSEYTCDGGGVNPEISVSQVPNGTQSLVLIIEDPDATAGTWIHWLMWNIPATLPVERADAPGVQGTNSWGRSAYGGPCPPSGIHRYFFRVYALDINLSLQKGSTKTEVLSAMKGHILANGELIGTYLRK
jgi:Raf kinase inhibitor-like YbhB/YbcL family protein